MATRTEPAAPPTAQGPGPARTGPDDPAGARTLRPVPSAPPSPADRLTVRAWWDPGLAAGGHDPRSTYVERFWLAILGPSTVLLLRRLARGLELHPGGFRASLPDTARSLGLGTGAGRHGPLNRTIDRACTFGLARRTDPATLLVRTRVPSLNPHQVAQLPLVLQRSHREWERSADTDRGPGTPPAAA